MASADAGLVRTCRWRWPPGACVWLLLLRTGPLVEYLLGFLGRHRFLAIGASGLLGLVIPMCECGIIPVMRRLLRKGLPLSCCVAYMLTGPIINIVVLLSTYVAFRRLRRLPDGRRLDDAAACRSSPSWSPSCTALVVERLWRQHGDELLTPLARPQSNDDPANNENGEPQTVLAAYRQSVADRAARLHRHHGLPDHRLAVRLDHPHAAAQHAGSRSCRPVFRCCRSPS